ncbi:response regulator [Devosia aquimaris]|uniref:hypothetical protein n=1 Tax=Devosia aquimaris TaxID=2866214 RepID=UPI001CD13B33|nr:hypothetical protein [Devosia sp. CJK-A8-3]
MNDDSSSAPQLALIDDDSFSAGLLMRTLEAQGGPEMQWYGNAERGAALLSGVLGGAPRHWPSAVIVDLKAHSGANLEFITAIRRLVASKGISVLVMTAAADSAARAELIAAGAAAVFTRHADVAAYRDEAMAILEFWSLSQRPEAVGM